MEKSLEQNQPRSIDKEVLKGASKTEEEFKIEKLRELGTAHDVEELGKLAIFSD